MTITYPSPTRLRAIQYHGLRDAEAFRAGMLEREKAAETVAPVSGPVNPDQRI